MDGVPQLLIGATMGSALIVLGLVPGLFQDTVEGVHNAVESASSLLLFRFPVQVAVRGQVKQPRWLAVVGAALVAVTLAYFPN